MNAWIAFTKKEIMAQTRSVKPWLLAGIFVLLSLMNIAIAKLTPLLMEALEDVLAQSGMAITQVSVTALDSWVQFFKNIPMALIAFVLLEGNIFTREYGSGTLILSLTKGLNRYKVVVSKAAMLVVLWTLGYWLSFGVTYAGTACFWDNSIAQNLLFSGVCWWVFGLLVTALTVLFSVLGSSFVLVLLGTGGVAFGAYTLSIIPKIDQFLPTYLTNGTALIYGTAQPKDFIPALIITGMAAAICFAASISIFNKKRL